MNSFKKYCENVFVAETEEKYNKGDLITLSTKYGKEVECEVYNLVQEVNNKFYYSIIRIEDMSYAERKATQYQNSVDNHMKKSDEYYQKSKEGADFLVLAEPIKIGHHSEKRHRALIERNDKRMQNCINQEKEAELKKEKAEYWANKAKEINLSMPESLEFYSFKLEEAKAYHQGLKDKTIPKKHSYSMQYANKEVKTLTRKVKIATILWGVNHFQNGNS